MAAPQRIRQMLVDETNQGEDGQLTRLVNPLDLSLSSLFLPIWMTDCRIAHIGSNEAEVPYNIKEQHCLPLKVLFASQSSFLYLDSSLEEQSEEGTLVVAQEVMTGIHHPGFFQLLQEFY